MKKLFLIVISAVALVNATEAVIVQKLYLKDGSVLSGYIQKQDDNGNLTFHSDEAMICINNENVNIFNERNYNVKELDKAWVTWAEKNDEFEGLGDHRTLSLADVSSKANNVSRVKILERGAVVKYLEKTPNTYSVAWKEVNFIKGEKRSKTALSGINRIYQLKSGVEYEGQYAEENDSMLTLYLNNGMRQSLKIDEVIKYTFRPINPNQSIFAQSELLDVVKTKNGNEVRGVIIEQNYTSKKDSENYFLVQQESGAIQSIKLSDIIETRKEENSNYAPQFDILLKEGDVVINRHEVQVINTREKNDDIILDSLSQKVVIAKDPNNNTKIIVEYYNDTNTNVEVYQLVKVKSKKVKKDVFYGFGYRDLVNALFRPIRIETSVNHTTKVEYLIGGQGNFALYDAKKKVAIPFIIN